MGVGQLEGVNTPSAGCTKQVFIFISGLFNCVYILLSCLGRLGLGGK